MVYITFPANMTEEEQMLQAKYQKLKKRKKALQALKAPKQEAEKQLIPKRAVDARDAREVARKLFKSGAIPAIQKPQMKQDQMSFKRPKGQERKRVIPESNVASYQPFSATQPDGFQGAASSLERDTNRVHNLYQQIATERDREERGLTEKKATETLTTLTTHRTEKQRTGNTICVSGNNVTEEFLRSQFATFGKIVSVSMEIEKGRGFITFIKTESAERAINDMHSKTVSGISLQVQLARRQPQIEPINHASSSVVWSTLAASHSQKGGSAKDKRKMVEYEDDFFKHKITCLSLAIRHLCLFATTSSAKLMKIKIEKLFEIVFFLNFLLIFFKLFISCLKKDEQSAINVLIMFFFV